MCLLPFATTQSKSEWSEGEGEGTVRDKCTQHTQLALAPLLSAFPTLGYIGIDHPSVNLTQRKEERRRVGRTF